MFPTYTVTDACSAASYSSCVPVNRLSRYADSLVGSWKSESGEPPQRKGERRGNRRARVARVSEGGGGIRTLKRDAIAAERRPREDELFAIRVLPPISKKVGWGLGSFGEGFHPPCGGFAEP